MDVRTGTFAFKSGPASSTNLRGELRQLKQISMIGQGDALQSNILHNATNLKEDSLALPSAYGVIGQKPSHQPESFFVHPAVLDNCTQVNFKKLIPQLELEETLFLLNEI